MTNARINHTGHNHPATPAGRAACRAHVATFAPTPDHNPIEWALDRVVSRNLDEPTVAGRPLTTVDEILDQLVGLDASTSTGYAVTELATPGRDYIGRNCKTGVRVSVRLADSAGWTIATLANASDVDVARWGVVTPDHVLVRTANGNLFEVSPDRIR
jgi:hypothetical protein